jgi:hypothetical protein
MDTFSVYITAFPGGPGSLIKEGERMEPEAAVKLAHSCANRVAVNEVRIVCDQDDTTAWEWKRDTGMVFPEHLKGRHPQVIP